MMKELLVSDLKRPEFARGGSDVRDRIADMVRHLFADRGEEPSQFVSRPFGYQLDAAIRQVANKPGHNEAARQVTHRIAKAHSLHVPGVVDFAALGIGGRMGFGHAGVDASGRYGARERFSISRLLAPFQY